MVERNLFFEIRKERMCVFRTEHIQNGANIAERRRRRPRPGAVPLNVVDILSVEHTLELG